MNIEAGQASVLVQENGVELSDVRSEVFTSCESRSASEIVASGEGGDDEVNPEQRDDP